MTKDNLLYIIHQVFEDADDKLLSQYESKYSCMPERNELFDAQSILEDLVMKYFTSAPLAVAGEEEHGSSQEKASEES
jgi:hypothetical protein